MQIRADQLRENLKKGLKPVYFIYGDEPLQLRDYTDMVRKAAAYFGYTEVEKYTADASFDWQQLLQSSMEMSLFSSCKLIELHLQNGKPGDKGSKALISYSDNIPQDTVLLIYSGKLDSSVQRSKWFKTLDKQAVRVPLYPMDQNQALRWIAQRLQQEKLHLEQDSIMQLYLLTEGNLLACDQEIIKLGLHYNPQCKDIQNIHSEQLTHSLSDNSHFNYFHLFDTALKGQAQQVYRMMEQFQQDNTALMLLLALISKEIQFFSKVQEKCRTQSLQQALAGEYIFAQRKNLVVTILNQHPHLDWRGYLGQLSAIEQAFKGIVHPHQGPLRPWKSLTLLLLEISTAMKI